MNAPQQSGPSRAFFSLSGGIEVASGQSALEAVGRAKQASVLFDEIVMESGLHIVEVVEDRLPMTRRIPGAGVSSALLENTRTVTSNTRTGVAVRARDSCIELYVGTDLPDLEGAQYIDYEVDYRYVSEFHSGLLDDLARLGADWVEVVSVTRPEGEPPAVSREDLAVTPEAGDTQPFARVELDPREAEKLAEQITIATTNEPSGETEGAAQTSSVPVNTEQLLAQGLTDAVEVAQRLDAVPALSGAFEHVAAAKGVPIGLPGTEGLGFIVPNFSSLPWEAIAEFRDHPGAVEARHHLRAFESEAASRAEQGSAEFVRSTGQAVTQGLLAATNELAPNLPEELQSPVLGTAVGLIPVVGQYASLAVSMGDMISAVRRSEEYEGSWVAAMFELRDRAADSLVDW